MTLGTAFPASEMGNLCSDCRNQRIRAPWERQPRNMALLRSWSGADAGVLQGFRSYGAVSGRPQRQPPEAHHFAALVHEPELGIGDKPIPRRVRPLRDIISRIHIALIRWTSGNGNDKNAKKCDCDRSQYFDRLNS